LQQRFQTNSVFGCSLFFDWEQDRYCACPRRDYSNANCLENWRSSDTTIFRVSTYGGGWGGADRPAPKSTFLHFVFKEKNRCTTDQDIPCTEGYCKSSVEGCKAGLDRRFERDCSNFFDFEEGEYCACPRMGVTNAQCTVTFFDMNTKTYRVTKDWASNERDGATVYKRNNKCTAISEDITCDTWDCQQTVGGCMEGLQPRFATVCSHYFDWSFENYCACPHLNRSNSDCSQEVIDADTTTFRVSARWVAGSSAVHLSLVVTIACAVALGFKVEIFP